MKNYLPIIAVIVAVVALFSALVLKPTPIIVPQQFGSGFAATFADTTASSTKVILNTSSSQAVITSNAREAYWEICNLGTTPVYLSLGSAAATSSGILISPQASSTQTCTKQTFPTIFVGNIYAIPNVAASTTLGVNYGIAL